jgi:hypothetical protein
MNYVFVLFALNLFFKFQIVFAEESLINRSLLTVGDNIYTIWDSYALISIDKFVSQNYEPIEVNFFESKNLPFLIQDVQGGNIGAELKETISLLFFCLAYEESLKLKIFIPDSKMKISIKNKFLAEKDSFLPKIFNSKKLGQINSVFKNVEDTDRYMEVVLRALAFQKARGALSKNPSLLNQFWFWNKQIQLFKVPKLP